VKTCKRIFDRLFCSERYERKGFFVFVAINISQNTELEKANENQQALVLNGTQQLKSKSIILKYCKSPVIAYGKKHIKCARRSAENWSQK
jgi:hypothetical protein